MNYIIQIIIGFFLVDIVSGIFHWFEDRYLSYCTNIQLFKSIAEDNEMHHYFPRSILASSYLENILNSIIISFIIILILFITNKPLLFKYKYLFLSFFIFGSIVNLLHRYSHMRDCENNTFIKFIQKTGLILTHDFHSVHHEKANEKFCVITIYTNFILDGLHFWNILENIIYMIFGIKPKPYLYHDTYYAIHDYRHINSKLECPDKPTKKDIKELKEKLKIFKNCRI